MTDDPHRPLNETELAVAHAVWFAIGGPDGQDWLDAQRLARGALEAIEDQGYVVMSRSALDELERQTDPDYEPPYGAAPLPTTATDIPSVDGGVFEWDALGARCIKRPKVSGTRVESKGAYRLRAPRRAREDWVIEAVHGSYLGRHPYNLGPDAWRISIQVPRGYDDRLTEVAHLVATSEAEAIASLAWLEALSGTWNRSGFGP